MGCCAGLLRCREQLKTQAKATPLMGCCAGLLRCREQLKTQAKALEGRFGRNSSRVKNGRQATAEGGGGLRGEEPFRR